MDRWHLFDCVRTERCVRINRRTTVKDWKKEIGKGLLGKMLADLGIAKDDF